VRGPNALDEFVVTYAAVEIDEGSHGARLDDCFLDICPRKAPYSFHGLPTCQHDKLKLAVKLAPTEIGANKSREFA
jgi:hypothetical protein